jgi:hypothetical protein
MRCETCGAPGRPICSDPDDPWPLCAEHEAELGARVAEAEEGPFYTLDEVLEMMPRRRRLELRVLRAMRPLRVTDVLIWWNSRGNRRPGQP